MKTIFILFMFLLAKCDNKKQFNHRTISKLEISDSNKIKKHVTNNECIRRFTDILNKSKKISPVKFKINYRVHLIHYDSTITSLSINSNYFRITKIVDKNYQALGSYKTKYDLQKWLENSQALPSLPKDR